jgi:hypothetical protein
MCRGFGRSSSLSSEPRMPPSRAPTARPGRMPLMPRSFERAHPGCSRLGFLGRRCWSGRRILPSHAIRVAKNVLAARLAAGQPDISQTITGRGRIRRAFLSLRRRSSSAAARPARDRAGRTRRRIRDPLDRMGRVLAQVRRDQQALSIQRAIPGRRLAARSRGPAVGARTGRIDGARRCSSAVTKNVHRFATRGRASRS